MQLNVLKECQRASEHARLLLKSDHSLEVSQHEEAGNVDWAHVPRALPIVQSRRADTGDRGRGRDIEVLERVPTEKGIK
jgi:hypothetical protein